MKVFLTATMLRPSLCIKEKDMADPVVSVVIPAYRSGPLLREAVDSIMGQTFQDFEIILVDNNADEETKTIISEVCALYPEKV
jgi:glycosyltransferase involved in cell wall biosynthesis